uniref:Uncharacterized protein n=1 Tax=Electrophorus electricus TaxID=8005 RepID=A0AAY5E7H0_ELEEL
MQISNRVEIWTLVPQGSPEIFMTLHGRGLRGGGRFGQTTPPLVEFLKDILRRYPEGGQILKVGLIMYKTTSKQGLKMISQ